MAAAVVKVYLGTGASVTWATVDNEDAGSLKWNRYDSSSNTTPIPIPPSGTAATKYGFLKSLCLYVATVGTTTMSNRKVSLASSPATGLSFSFKAVAVSAYDQSDSGNTPADAGTDNAVPATYTAMTTSPQTYDAGNGPTTSTGPNEATSSGTGICICVPGLASTYAGGPGTNNASPSLTFTYDEV